ncbi:hypothetical protein [Microbulbifer epialgicus]|uniref:Replication region DNA-binding N-term n=1 Tax=Microbulbifer epialgicus TaxID=393907 RepID=A0ABV4NUJ6_9GAMM
MKASEDNVFPVCDKFFSKYGKYPTGDELVKLCGGGKKEILVLRDKWKCLQFLKENNLNIPTRWISLLGEFFNEARVDIEAERSRMKEEVNSKLEEVNIRLQSEIEKRVEAEKSVDRLKQNIETRNREYGSLQESLAATEKRVRSLESIRDKQTAEINEKSLQRNLLIDQITELKQEKIELKSEHKSVLEKQQEQHNAVIKSFKEDLANTSSRYDEVRDHNELLVGKLMVAESEYDRVKGDLTQIRKERRKERKEAEENFAALERTRSELASMTVVADRVPELEKNIRLLEKRLEKFNGMDLEIVEGFREQIRVLTNSINAMNENEISKNP